MRQSVFWRVLIVSLAIVAVACVGTVFALQHRFSGYDLSPLIDSGWRVLCGQVPNRDFICVFPPLLYLATAVAFKILGVRWMSLSIASALFTFAVVALGQRALFLSREKLGDRRTLTLCVVYAALQLIPYLVVGHPWHSSWTEGLALYLIATTFAMGELADTSRSIQIELLSHLTLAMTLLLLAKPNVGYSAILFCVVTLFMARGLARQTLASVTSAIFISSLLLMRVHTSLITTFSVYRQLTARMQPVQLLDGIQGFTSLDERLPLVLVYLTVLPAGIWTVTVILRRLFAGRSNWVDVLCIGACLLTPIGWGTNAEYKLVDSPCMLFGAAILASAVSQATDEARTWRLHGAYGFLLYLLLGVSMFYAGSRARMQTGGAWGQDNCGAEVERTDAFFGTFYNCAPFFSLLSEADSIVDSHPGAHFFFGPRMEFLYARERVPSPRGLPNWWHPNTSFVPQQVPAIRKAWRSDHLDILVFLYNDRTRMPNELLQDIRQYWRRTLVSPPCERRPEAKIDVYAPRDVAIPDGVILPYDDPVTQDYTNCSSKDQN